MFGLCCCCSWQPLEGAFESNCCCLPRSPIFLCSTAQSTVLTVLAPLKAPRYNHFYHFFIVFLCCLFLKRYLPSLTSRQKMPRNVAIIGAGCAGLSAARVLLECPEAEVTIFEARDRIGGRILTNEKASVDLGASYIRLFCPCCLSSC